MLFAYWECKAFVSFSEIHLAYEKYLKIQIKYLIKSYTMAYYSVFFKNDITKFSGK